MEEAKVEGVEGNISLELSVWILEYWVRIFGILDRILGISM